MTDEERDELVKKVDAAINVLREHFQHVQILVSWEAEDGTQNTYDIFRGKGNWYARVGMAREFLTRDVSHTQAHEIKEQLHPDEPSE